MKLLPKSEAQAATAAKQRQDIDAGVKLAKRVDATRETLLIEEKKLEEFRTRRVKEINDEITPLETELGALKTEVSALKRERIELQKPLDKEWAAVREAKKQATHDTANAHSLLATAQEADRQARQAVRKASDTLARALTKEERVRDSLVSAHSADKESKERLKNARKVENEAIRLVEEGEREFTTRDNAYALKEHGLILREANLIESEADLAKGWKLLNDRKAAFERRITRAKT